MFNNRELVKCSQMDVCLITGKLAVARPDGDA